MDLPLDKTLKLGIQTLHRRTEPAEGAWLPTIEELERLVRRVDDCGDDSLWVGDHLAFTTAVPDPLLQLAQAAVLRRRPPIGTDVYLLPPRQAALVARPAAPFGPL